MFKLCFKLPRQITIAFSGGVDSVAVTHFLSKNHDVKLAFFHHGTKNSDNAASFALNFANKHGFPLEIGEIKSLRPKELSEEEHWRNERYNFLERFYKYVVTAHHLDDCVETYLYSSLHGRPKVIPFSRNGIIFRPFLTTKKQQFIDYANRKQLNWTEDLSNNDTKYMRNYIRNVMMPHVLRVNPGIQSTICKIVRSNQL